MKSTEIFEQKRREFVLSILIPGNKVEAQGFIRNMCNTWINGVVTKNENGFITIHFVRKDGKEFKNPPKNIRNDITYESKINLHTFHIDAQSLTTEQKEMISKWESENQDLNTILDKYNMLKETYHHLSRVNYCMYMLSEDLGEYEKHNNKLFPEKSVELTKISKDFIETMNSKIKFNFKELDELISNEKFKIQERINNDYINIY